MIFTARCYAERGIATASRLSVCLSVRPSVMLRYRDHIAFSALTIIARLVWGFCSLQFADPNFMDLLQEEHPKFWQ